MGVCSAQDEVKASVPCARSLPRGRDSIEGRCFVAPSRVEGTRARAGSPHRPARAPQPPQATELDLDRAEIDDIFHALSSAKG